LANIESIGFSAAIIALVVILSGCIESKNLNTDTPIRVGVEVTTDQSGNHGINILLYDIHNIQTTSDGVAEITILKGKFQDFSLNSPTEFVLKGKYNVKANEFKETQSHFREVTKTELAWSANLPDEFKPELADVYKINVVFQPKGSTQTLGNTTNIVWA
jgi:hypothetical protein